MRITASPPVMSLSTQRCYGRSRAYYPVIDPSADGLLKLKSLRAIKSASAEASSATAAFCFGVTPSAVSHGPLRLTTTARRHFVPPVAVSSQQGEDFHSEDDGRAEKQGGTSEPSFRPGDDDGNVSGSESDEFRARMEGLLQQDAEDQGFDGKQLAAMIYDKYGRSYDVQLIRMEVMGRQINAMNVMWKYREQKSFPLTYEQYIERLDYVAEALRLWGVVSIVRQSLAKTKERPRIGKAVSIRFDLDDSSERAREWIQR